MRPLVLLLLLAPLLAAAGPKPPTSAAYRKTFEHNQHAVVEVIGPKKRGPGVIVGAAGEVLTSVENVGLEAATVRIGKEELPAKVVLANAYLKVAIVKVDRTLRAPAVRRIERFEPGSWLIGIHRDRRRAAPQLGQVKKRQRAKAPFVDTTLKLAPGTPVFDPHGKLVGITVVRRKSGSWVIPVPVVQSQLVVRGEP